MAFAADLLGASPKATIRHLNKAAHASKGQVSYTSALKNETPQPGLQGEARLKWANKVVFTTKKAKNGDY